MTPSDNRPAPSHRDLDSLVELLTQRKRDSDPATCKLPIHFSSEGSQVTLTPNGLESQLRRAKAEASLLLSILSCVNEEEKLLHILRHRSLNASRGIGRLSTEILVDIFKYAYADATRQEDPHGSCTGVVTSLLGVCSHWLHTLMDHGIFWSSIKLTRYTPLDSIQRQLKRTRGSKLNLVIHFDMGIETDLTETTSSRMRLIQPILSRCRSLCITASGQYPPILPLNPDLVGLESLSLEWRMSSYNKNRGSDPIVFISSGPTPSLRHLTLDFYSFSDPTEELPRDLDLSTIDFGSLRSLTVKAGLFFPSLEVLRSCDRLERLVWTGDEDLGLETMASSINLPHLKHLEARECPPLLGLDSFEVENLETLIVAFGRGSVLEGRLFSTDPTCPHITEFVFRGVNISQRPDDTSSWKAFFASHQKLELVTIHCASENVHWMSVLGIILFSDERETPLNSNILQQAQLTCPRLRHLRLVLVGSPSDFRDIHNIKFTMLNVLAGRRVPISDDEPGFRLTVEFPRSWNLEGFNSTKVLLKDVMMYTNVRLLPINKEWDVHPNWPHPTPDAV